MKPGFKCLGWMAAVFILSVFPARAEEAPSKKKLKMAVELMPLPNQDVPGFRLGDSPCGNGILEKPAEECEIDSDCTKPGEFCNDTCACTVKEDPLRCAEGTVEQASDCASAGCAKPVTVRHRRTGEQKTCYKCANFTMPLRACSAGTTLSEAGGGDCCQEIRTKEICPDAGFTPVGTPQEITLKCCECSNVDTSHCWNGSVQSTQCGADGVIDLQFEAQPFSCGNKHRTSGGACIPLCTTNKRDCGGAL